MTTHEELLELKREICWRRRDPSDPDMICPCDGPQDCELGVYDAIPVEAFEELCDDLRCSPKQLLGLIRGTHVITGIRHSADDWRSR